MQAYQAELESASAAPLPDDGTPWRARTLVIWVPDTSLLVLADDI
jgi:hypothetical protein